MIVSGLFVTLAAWGALFAIGEATARLLFGQGYASVSPASRLPLGLAATICLLEGAGYFLAIRVAAWLLLVPAGYGVALIARRRRRFGHSHQRTVVGTSLVALALGLVPVVIARRFTAAALTNNDGTYYITVADRLRFHAWSTIYKGIPPDQCLTERVVHWWNWRTGTPNLMAAISAFSGMDSPPTLAVVTALLFACVPCAAVSVARDLGVARGSSRELLVGLLAACSAAPAFLGFQHMTGHLSAQSLFPLACGAVLGAVRLGGPRRHTHAALLLGSGIALFADAASVLVVIVVGVLLANVRRFPRAVLRTSLIGMASVLLAPFTLARVVRAALGTLDRKPSKVLFPQRGWLPRSPLDDFATVMGVDPWPPWPGGWSPNTQTLVMWLAAASGVALFGLGFGRLRRERGERVVAALLGGAVLLSMGLLEIRYLRGKVLLMGAAFAVPLCAVGAATILGRPRARWLIAPFALGELFALGQLVVPLRWKVVDRPAHDALVPELARLPSGSLVAFDGLGAPADAVLDAHRAERAALLADLRPIQPGLDGGFYLPACKTTPRPDSLPSRGYALQRVSSENLTRGKELAAWGGFRLLEVNLENPDGFIAAWAPTHGWMVAEQEPGGRVFRWAEWSAKGALQIVSPAPCARLKGELRVVHAWASAGIKVADDLVFTGTVSDDWLAFTTRPFNAKDVVVVGFEILRTSVPPPDEAHALALRSLSVDPVWRCGTVSRLGSTNEPATFPIEYDEEIELLIEPLPASECSDVILQVAGETGATLRLTVDEGAPALRYMNTPTDDSLVQVVGSAPRRLKLAHVGGSGGRRWQLLDVRVTPRQCPR